MGRRSTGTIEPRQSCIRLKFTHLGKRQVETLDLEPTPRNIKAAKLLLARITGAIDAGVYERSNFFDSPGKSSSRLTFEEYAKHWRETLTVAKSTGRLYEHALKHTWNPYLGNLPIVQVKYSDVLKALSARQKAVSNQTLNNHMSVVRQVFRMALADELIKSDPTRELKNLKKQKVEPDPFSSVERDQILERMHDRYHEQVWNYWTVSFFVGMRPSEQIALHWPDFDERKRQLIVRRAIVMSEEKVTKTNRIRRVDLCDAAFDAIVRQKKFSYMRDKLGPIFLNPNTGRAWASEHLQRESYFTPTLAALGIRHRDAYQARHTFATLLLMGGVNPKYVQRQLGHATLTMTLEVYATWLPQEDGGAQAKLMNAVLSGRPASLEGSG